MAKNATMRAGLEARPGGSAGERQAGFTILEVIATLLVISVTMAGLVAANERNLKSTERAIYREDCLMLAAERMEMALMGLDQNPSGDFAEKGDRYQAFRWERRDEEITVLGEEKIFRIAVTVRHTEERERPIEVTLTTYAR